jgi:hypothetical protein
MFSEERFDDSHERMRTNAVRARAAWSRFAQAKSALLRRIESPARDAHKDAIKIRDKNPFADSMLHVSLTSNDKAAHTQTNIHQGAAAHQPHGCLLWTAA